MCLFKRLPIDDGRNIGFLKAKETCILFGKVERTTQIYVINFPFEPNSSCLINALSYITGWM